MRKHLSLFLYEVYKKGFIKSYNNCVLNEKKNIEELSKIQEEKFLSLIVYSVKHVPYYRNLLKSMSFNSISDIKKIPFLTKKLINENQELLKSEEKNKYMFKKNSTSGSSGEATHFYNDKLDAFTLACAVRGDEKSGWRIGAKKLILWGASHDISNGIRFLIKKYLLNELILPSFNINEKTIIHYIKIINKYKPDLIIGYPSTLYFISEFIQNNNLELNHYPNCLISAGESLYEYQREIIENVFHASLLNRYGCREVGHIANECVIKKGLHYNIDHLIVEIIDKNGNTCKAGEPGEIVVTDLDNYAFPLIRYKIGDMGSISDSNKCICGSNLPILNQVLGRTFEVITGENGVRVFGNFWTLFFRYEIKGIKKFQVFQDTLCNLRLVLEINDEFSSIEEFRIINKIKNILGENTNIRIEIVSKITMNSSDKYKWVISKINS